MISRAVLYPVLFMCNCVLISGTIVSPLMKLNPGSRLSIFKSGEPIGRTEYDYAIVKRGPQEIQESPDSKERRSQMGSSFIRFGRNRLEGKLENTDYLPLTDDAAGNEMDSRMARGRSDVIIRFGRAESKNLHDLGTTSQNRQLSQIDPTKLLEYGSNHRSKLSYGHGHQHLDRANDIDRVKILCSNVFANANEGIAYTDRENYSPGKFFRLCNSLGFAGDDNYENNRPIARSKIIEILEDAVSQVENAKRE